MKGVTKKAKKRIPSMAVVLGLMVAVWSGRGEEAVVVSARFDTNVIGVGESTVLRVYGQVSASIEGDAERIFTWYVDVFNGDGGVAQGDYESMVKTASDNDPLISGTGLDDGEHRRGIRDSFFNLPGAGVSNEVELVAIPVMGVGEGVVTFSVGAGSGVTNLVEDFIVAPMGGGPMYTGGDYSGASAELEVVGVGCELRIRIERGENGGQEGGTLLLSFEPCSGYDHTVEYTEALETGAIWSEVSGGPHNSGMVTVTNTVAARFYRVRAEAPLQKQHVLRR